MSEKDVVSFSYGIAFAKDDYAKDYLEKSVNFFTTIENIEDKHQQDLYLALKEKIKYYFKDDEKKKRELITMITKSVTDIGYNELSHQEKMEILLNEREKVIKDKNDTINQKDKEIKDKDNALNLKDKEIKDKDNALNLKDKEIKDKDKEIEKLKKQLNQQSLLNSK